MAKLSKKQIKALSEKLALKPVTVWEKAGPKERKEIWRLAERYKDFLDRAKTERLSVEHIRGLAEKSGFAPLGKKSRSKKFYAEFQGKVIALAVLGQRPPSAGLRLIGAHLDAPRLDLKMHPLYESQELAFLKTHYYGGIKKYHWLARPLAIHGVVCTKDGKKVEMHLGDEPDEPVFSLLDVSPHLGRKSQSDKKVSDAFEAERMNLLIGGLPLEAAEGAGNNKVKLAVLAHLNEQYGITEADLISAELEIVPAGKARDVGLDRSLIGAYAQDDRACAFAGLEAILHAASPEMTCLALMVDKEEIGSDGSTSARSRFLELTVAGLLAAAGEDSSYLAICKSLAASQAVSADVTGAFDPDFPEVHEKQNAAYLGHGVVLTKYTGSGGKYGASDANAEYLAWIRRIWDEAEVVWQAAGMGKIDEGGGGTIAKLLAVHGMEIVDAGPALLGLHAPFEITHKADIYSACEAFRAFFQAPARKY